MPKLESATCPNLRPFAKSVPRFPKSMLDERREGWVILEFDVSPNDAMPHNIRVRASSHPGGKFEKEAVRALQSSKYIVNSAHEACLSVTEFKIRR